VLAEAVKDVKHRKIELEPGCAVHFISEAEAAYSGELIETTLQSRTSIAQTMMPSLLLQNLPDTVSVERLRSSFEKFDPKIVRLVGGQTFQVRISLFSSNLKNVLI
jgi:hypothetical protein